MNKLRRMQYRWLRAMRQERDYQVGKLQYANRPYTKPTARMVDGQLKHQAVTSKQFMKSYKPIVVSPFFFL